MVSDQPRKAGPLLNTEGDRTAHAEMRDLVLTSSTGVLEMPLGQFIEEVGLVQVETAKVPTDDLFTTSPSLDAVETLALALYRFQKVALAVAGGPAVAAVGVWCLDGGEPHWHCQCPKEEYRQHPNLRACICCLTRRPPLVGEGAS